MDRISELQRPPHTSETPPAPAEPRVPAAKGAPRERRCRQLGPRGHFLPGPSRDSPGLSGTAPPPSSRLLPPLQLPGPHSVSQRCAKWEGHRSFRVSVSLARGPLASGCSSNTWLLGTATFSKLQGPAVSPVVGPGSDVGGEAGRGQFLEFNVQIVSSFSKKNRVLLMCFPVSRQLGQFR